MKKSDIIRETAITIDYESNKIILDTTDPDTIKLLSEELGWTEDIDKRHSPYRRFLGQASQVSFKSKKMS